jgi:hypothetical protein
VSFDLAVLSGFGGEDAVRSYLDAPAPVETLTRPELAAFYRDLTTRHPELHEDLDRSPWTAQLSLTDQAVIMTIQRSRAARVEADVRSLAARRGLAVYDYQRDTVDPLIFTTSDGSRADNPGTSAIETALRALPPGGFAILERRDHYVQTMRQRGGHVLERRDGSPDGSVSRSVFPARHAGLRFGGMGTVSDDIGPCEST